ncbi:transposase family protein [Novosphingobium sp. Fuku2-ISO-50]|uniref:transposase family protein n=1 Tax=Novosphingobium sp. Fuku2-ISO-50 TaxID=1739114 RepID=UPI00076C725F|nr:transposase family protein [Novosphingobium sp. Fuku2-ISO-50]KUR77942.1 hypothetical protein AQZ50_09350 [Novosphingobium sp. Fuku2-ISO-50]
MLYGDIGFLDYFSNFPDQRQLINVVYLLDEMALLSLLAVPAGAVTFFDIARFGENKLYLRRRFPPFQQCFVAWVAGRDRQTNRRSFQKKGATAPPANSAGVF